MKLIALLFAAAVCTAAPFDPHENNQAIVALQAEQKPVRIPAALLNPLFQFDDAVSRALRNNKPILISLDSDDAFEDARDEFEPDQDTHEQHVNRAAANQDVDNDEFFDAAEKLARPGVFGWVRDQVDNIFGMLRRPAVKNAIAPVNPVNSGSESKGSAEKSSAVIVPGSSSGQQPPSIKQLAARIPFFHWFKFPNFFGASNAQPVGNDASSSAEQPAADQPASERAPAAQTGFVSWINGKFISLIDAILGPDNEYDGNRVPAIAGAPAPEAIPAAAPQQAPVPAAQQQPAQPAAPKSIAETIKENPVKSAAAIAVAVVAIWALRDLIANRRRRASTNTTVTTTTNSTVDVSTISAPTNDTTL